MSEQTNILESFILNKAPSNVPSIESKLLIQNLKSKIKQLERKIDGKHSGIKQQLLECEQERNFYFEECMQLTGAVGKGDGLTSFNKSFSLEDKQQQS